jgi:FtsP/CotA-like multicopper oxidase with cupredoxin domain
MRRVLSIVLPVLGVGALVAALGWLGWQWNQSRLPATYSVMEYGSLDFGGGPAPKGFVHGHEHPEAPGTGSVADLRGPEGVPDDRFTLTAKEGKVQLASGRTIDALTFNGTVPGPELRVKQGDLVEVKLVNGDVSSGVTIHWHGVDVPNAEDGVAGVTQNAVLPGQSYVYRFRANQVGTFWYHTHQVSSKEVARGLYGAFVIEPRDPPAHPALDLTLVAHTFDVFPALNLNDRLERRAVDPGTPVRLRLVNSDSTSQRFVLSGTRFRVLALDGTDLHGPQLIANHTVEVPAGGRADLGFAMPDTPVRLSLDQTQAGLAFSRDGSAAPSAPHAGPLFDPTTYGVPAATPFGLASHYDRRFDLSIGQKLAFLDGKPGRQWSIDGHVYPDVPVFVVAKGDLVEVTISNHTRSVHPMHLHGHHVLVLSLDGKPTSGSPWWPDTLTVKPGQSYVVGFRADNPGIWMDHCHNLVHAAAGLTMHLAYAGVTTPFDVGDVPHNRPE